MLHSPHAVYAFEDNVVVIPEVVLEELDRFKAEASDRGASSRESSRIFDRLRTCGNLLAGVPLNEQGGILRIETNHLDTCLPPYWDRSKPDNRILQVCRGLAEKGCPTILVSRDTNMRVKATILNLPAEDYRNEKVPSIENQYTGRGEVYASSKAIDAFHADDHGGIDPAVLTEYNSVTQGIQAPALEVNQFLLIRSTDNDRHNALGRFDGEKVVHLHYHNRNPFGVVPRNIGQVFMQECLMLSAEEAPLCIFKGPAGTAKTFYALAVGLHKCLEQRPRQYHHVLICRPNVPMDEEIGFLPGTEKEKIDPYMRAVRDNLFILMSGNAPKEPKEVEQLEETVQMLFDQHTIRTEALAYQRGRSLQQYWMILDEMQNSTPRQAKGVITRPGLGTKIILLGDPSQIDHPYLDSRTNGLSFASEKMRGSHLCYQVTLTHEECERSPLATEAAFRL